MKGLGGRLYHIDITMEVNILKKQLFICLSIIFVMLALAACGTEDAKTDAAGDKESTASSTEQAATDATDQSTTRLYKHAMGETEIPAKPERVVTLQYASQMISVGLKPIGALDYLLDTPDPAFEGIEDVAADLVDPVVDAPVREPLRLVPFDVGVHVRQHGVHVPARERLVGAGGNGDEGHDCD